MRFLRTSSAVVAALLPLAGAIKLDPDSPASIRKAASTVGYGLMSYYKNNGTGADPAYVGTFPFPPYYWWESGAIWGGMVDYRAITGDRTWQHTTTEALLAQVGPAKNFIMAEQRFDTGNDDQLFWVFAALSALENGYPERAHQDPTWLDLAENAFDNVIPRWDTKHCDGGLRWQIYPENNGYTYKNAISNGALFQVAARLARYTGKPKYVKWANKAYDWSRDIGFVTDKYEVYDGVDINPDCSKLNPMQWSYNNAVYMHGAATMYNLTGAKKWADRTRGFVHAAGAFYSPYKNATNVAYEAVCEPWMTCNTDQFSFKAYLARFQAKTALLAPFTGDIIRSRLRASATAAARSCSGGKDGVTCGTKWYVDGWDGTKGAGQQLSAMETFLSLLVSHDNAPATLPNVKLAGARPHAPRGRDSPTSDAIQPRDSSLGSSLALQRGVGASAAMAALVVAAAVVAGW